MLWWCLFILVTIFIDMTCAQKGTSDRKEVFIPWQASWRTFPTTASSWSLLNRIPMTTEFEDYGRKGNSKFKVKKFKKYILPLLLAYKLKFFALTPVLVGGLLLLTATTGLAGFFFALFSAAMGLKSGGWSH